METLTAATAAPAAQRAKTAALPWYCYAVVLGATSIVVGILWDISWHQTIGRDTFWTPAHMAIYLVVRMAGVEDNVLRFGGRTGGERPLLGLSRATRRVGGDLGFIRNADLRAVRQLVAQGLRPGRANHQSAAFGAGRGDVWGSTGRNAAGVASSEHYAQRTAAGARNAGLRRRRVDRSGRHDGD